MADFSTEYLNRVVEYQHYIENYKFNVYAGLVVYFDRMIKEIRKLVRAEVDGVWTIALRNKINRNIKEITNRYFTQIQENYLSEVEQFYYADLRVKLNIMKDLVEQAEVKYDLEEPDDWNRFNNTNATFEDGRATTIPNFIKLVSGVMLTRLYQNIERGRTLRLNANDILSGMDGTLRQARNGLNAVSATGITLAGTLGDRGIYRKNSGLISGFEHISVLDRKTSDTCIFRSGKYWLYDAPEKSTLPDSAMPPLHPRCRSSTAPITFTAEELGITNPTKEQQEFFNGRTSTQPSYSEFINSQPKDVQIELLGRTRYDMWKNGEVKLDSFYGDDGRKLTLSQLERRGLEIPEKYRNYVRE